MALSRRRVYELLWATSSQDLAARRTSSALIALIAFNVLASILQTDADLASSYAALFFWIESISVSIFCLEYALRLWACVESPAYGPGWTGRLRWIRSPFALIDLLAITPFFLAFAFTKIDLRILRAMQLFRVFRLFKLGRYSDSFHLLERVWYRTRFDLALGSFVASILILISASLMWAIERDAQPDTFSSIPKALWWAVVTATTIGYGDAFPITPLGKTVGGIIAYLGICVFALPVGIIGAAFVDEIQERRKKIGNKARALNIYGTHLSTSPLPPSLQCPHCHLPLDPDELLLQAALIDQSQESPPPPPSP